MKRVVRALAAAGVVVILAVPGGFTSQVGADHVDLSDWYVRTCEWIKVSDDQVIHACGIFDARGVGHSQHHPSGGGPAGGGGTASAYILQDGGMVRDQTVRLWATSGGVYDPYTSSWRNRASGYAPVPGGPISAGSRPVTTLRDGMRGRISFYVHLLQPDGTWAQWGDRHHAESDPFFFPE